MKRELPLITIEDCYSYADVIKKLGLSKNGTNTTLAKNYIITKEKSFSNSLRCRFESYHGDQLTERNFYVKASLELLIS